MEEKIGIEKEIDVATLGDLCLDILLNVPELPPDSFEERKAYTELLSKSPPAKKFWEAGGSCNVVIAARRLGLSCVTIGHVGSEIYGGFLLDVLRHEGIGFVEIGEESEVQINGSLFETVLCWVLIDPLQRHDFCCRTDFVKEPILSWMSKLANEATMAIKKSKILLCDGYGFEELSPALILCVLGHALEAGTSIFFDPGPRGEKLSAASTQQQYAFAEFLRMSDVILLNSEEAESLTGIANPVLAGLELLRKGLQTRWVIVKVGAKGATLITTSSIICAPAFKVSVVDSVGCGDSFGAAIALGFLRGMPTVHTLTLANAVGAATAMGGGAGRNVATTKQVVELLEAADLNEDDEFWNDVVHDQHLDAQEITLLSTMVVNGGTGRNVRVNRFPLQMVVSEMLPKLYEQSRGVHGSDWSNFKQI
ncbi:hypothetical protein U1Q18_034027 [Sarracenia purpurea var. burkii]